MVNKIIYSAFSTSLYRSRITNATVIEAMLRMNRMNNAVFSDSFTVLIIKNNIEVSKNETARERYLFIFITLRIKRAGYDTVIKKFRRTMLMNNTGESMLLANINSTRFTTKI